MEIYKTLITLRTTLATILLVLFTPLLLIATALTKCYEYFVSKPPKSVVGEVAVVTGAAHGLGRAIALELAKIGCHIAVVDIDTEGAKETVRLIQKISKVKAKSYKVNVASFAEVTQLGANVVQDLGAVTILINNAGIVVTPNAPEDVQRMIDVNLTSHFWTKDAFLPTMKKLRRGHIVTISSLASLLPMAYVSTYVATKFGATGHMKSLRLELGVEKQKNIHVTTVMPSFLDTNDWASKVFYASKGNTIYPIIEGKTAASRIVRGMLAGEREIKMPLITDIVYRIFTILPISWQETMILLVCSESFRIFAKNEH